MLLDNTTRTEENKPYTVAGWMGQYSQYADGELDIAVGYFSINGLLHLQDKFGTIAQFRLILENLTGDDSKENRVVDLLNGDYGIDQSLLLPTNAQRAVAFLEQEKVHVRTVLNNFCHAKAYIHRANRADQNSFYIVGSSNLTDAGLGLRDSGNMELNIANTGEGGDFNPLKKWFERLWNDVAKDTIETDRGASIKARQYFIDLISAFYREYTPEELYYKVLYELFKNDLHSLSSDNEFNQGVSHLRETIVFTTLYPFQKQGAISLIKMLQTYNGAILADAVGLGKTWTALAVMKFFELKGYTVLVFCPKKLRQNWERYRSHNGSCFDRDELNYYVRNITDLQDDRLNKYTDLTLTQIQRKQKLLIVVDESHNLRNDKSSRYEFFVEEILRSGKKSKDVKVLHLSATPINNQMLDIRNQFKLMARGNNEGFADTPLDIPSLEEIFRQAQKDFNEWGAKGKGKISDFISKLPQKFFDLTDALIVARTRKLIEGEYAEIQFPKKEKPTNQYITPDKIGELKSFDEILKGIENIDFAAYRPANYIAEERVHKVSVLKDEKLRQQFLAKMMYILMIKRLESSWHSLKITVENILAHHERALTKVIQYEESVVDTDLDLSPDIDEESETLEDAEIAQPRGQFTLGKKNPVPLSTITRLDDFKVAVANDIEKLTGLKRNLDQYEADFRSGIASDPKLDKLVELIQEKQKNSGNKKVLIFTGFFSTAKFLFDELRNRGIADLAYVSGTQCETFDGGATQGFEQILQRFAPITKLYKEMDWTELYEESNIDAKFFDGGKWDVPLEKWADLIYKFKPEYDRKLKNPIDVLIATDCLSEGQNLQDCDYVINYDIHWNPVRLIQRMGRIDRLGSPNESIRGVNFWPAKDYESYLGLKTRVEKRMALMSIVGSEIEDGLTPDLHEMVKENPIATTQEEKMLRQLELTWDDIEGGEETFGLNNLSLEQFRQELFDFFKKHEESFKQIPNGVFTGFRLRPDTPTPVQKNGIIAALGYPRRPPEAKDHTYKEIYLLHNDIGRPKITAILNNNQEILAFLRKHKGETRFVPEPIDNGDKAALDELAKAISQWIADKAPVEADRYMDGLFSGEISPKSITQTGERIEDKFQPESFDLVTWTVVSS